MAWVPGTNKVFFTQQGGKIGVIEDGKQLNRACRQLDVIASGERGALGIAVHPNFQVRTTTCTSITRTHRRSRTGCTRFTVRRNRCRDPEHIVTGIAIGQRLSTTAGRSTSWKASSSSRRATAALPRRRRIRTRGSGRSSATTSTAPFRTTIHSGPTNSVWSYGHRNGFGLAHNPRTDRIYQSENGPECDDELNLIKRGPQLRLGHRLRLWEPGRAEPQRPVEELDAHHRAYGSVVVLRPDERSRRLPLHGRVRHRPAPPLHHER